MHIFNLPRINVDEGTVTTFIIAAEDIESLKWYTLSQTMRTKLNDNNGDITIIRTRSGEHVWVNLNLHLLLDEWAAARGSSADNVIELS